MPVVGEVKTVDGPQANQPDSEGSPWAAIAVVGLVVVAGVAFGLGVLVTRKPFLGEAELCLAEAEAGRATGEEAKHTSEVAIEELKKAAQAAEHKCALLESQISRFEANLEAEQNRSQEEIDMQREVFALATKAAEVKDSGIDVQLLTNRVSAAQELFREIESGIKAVKLGKEQVGLLRNVIKMKVALDDINSAMEAR